MENLIEEFEKILVVCEDDARKIDSQEIPLNRYDMNEGITDKRKRLVDIKKHAETLFRLGSEIASEGIGLVGKDLLSHFIEDLESWYKLADNPYSFPRTIRFDELKSEYLVIRPFIVKKLSAPKIKIKISDEISPIAKQCLNEAGLCFASMAYKACVVMLGVASEKALIDLFKFEFKKGDDEIKHEKIFSIIEKLKDAKKLKDSEKVLADIIRITRNEYGHPIRIDVEPEQVKSFMTSIPRYIDEIYKRILSI